MGVVLSLAGTACCLATTGISCACSLMGCCIGSAKVAAGGISVETANVFNVLLLGLVTIAVFVVRFEADDWNWDLNGIEFGCIEPNSTTTGLVSGTYAYCTGDAAVYRMCAGLAIYYGISCVLSFCGTRIHRGFWLWKILAVIGLCVGFMFIPEEGFNQDGFVWTARLFSTVFLFAQLILLLSFSYDWNDKWVANSETEGYNEKCWLGAILVCAFCLYVGTIAGIVMLYKEYSSCTVGSSVTTITMIAVVGLTLLSLFRDRLGDDIEPGAVLPAAVVSSYLVYQAWAALESNPDASCKPFDLDENGSISVGVIFTVLSLMWLAFQTSRSAGAFFRGGNAGVLGDDVEENDGEKKEDDNKNDSEGKNLLVAAFHAIMVCSTLYVSMVVTNWGAAQSSSQDAKGQMWVRIASQWVTMLLFLWTLVAPAVLPDRSFERTRHYSSSTRDSATEESGGASTNVTYV